MGEYCEKKRVKMGRNWEKWGKVGTIDKNWKKNCEKIVNIWRKISKKTQKLGEFDKNGEHFW